MIIAIVGATGLVGETLIKILNEKNLIENNELVLYASQKHDGAIVEHFGRQYTVHELKDDTIRKDADFAFFSAGSAVSLEFAKMFAQNGTYVIDNSNAFRRNANVPLVVPEINAGDISRKTKIIANPNCSTIALALPMFAVSKLSKIKRIIVSTYQAVSGAGKKGLFDLENNTSLKFPHTISNNIIPHIDKFLENGYTLEEDKMKFEIKKILHDNNIQLSATCVRVPLNNCHSESVYFELESQIPLRSIKRALNTQPGIIKTDDPQNNIYPMPTLANNKDHVFVGRIRNDEYSENAFHLFITMDNIRKGAALNAVQIMEYVTKSVNFY